MSLDQNQVQSLLQFVASVSQDKLNCEGCLQQVPELAESQMGNVPLSDLMQRVQNHLDNCPCCAAEYKTFLTALHAIVD